MRDLRKLKDEATEHARKGRWGRAAEVLAAVVAGDPRDLAAKQKLAEALRRSGSPGDAIRVYREVADAYAAQGDVIKAIAVCKVILDVDPAHEAAQSALAALHARRREEPARAVAVTPGRGLGSAEAPRAAPAAPAGPAGHEPTREIALAMIEPLAGGAREDEPAAEDGTPTWLERGSSVAVPPPTPEVAAARAAALGEVTHDLSSADEPLPGLEPGSAVAIPIEPPVARAAAPVAFGRASTSLAGPPEADALEIVIEPEPLEPEVEPAALPEVPLFSGLPRDAFVALAAGFARVEAPAGTVVVREGERGRSLFVVASGRLRVERARPGGALVLARVGEGDFFGEMALLSGDPRMASVVAEEDAELLEIDAPTLAEIGRAHPAVAVALSRFYRRRLLSNAVATSPVFAPFSAEDRAALVRRFEPVEVRPGEVLVREGERSEGLFVALSGRYDVVRGADGAPARIATLREGDLFGEMSCLRRQPATASVVAARRGIVLRLPRAGFAEVASSYPQVLELVAGLADERQQSLEALHAAPRRGAGPYFV